MIGKCFVHHPHCRSPTVRMPEVSSSRGGSVVLLGDAGEASIDVRASVMSPFYTEGVTSPTEPSRRPCPLLSPPLPSPPPGRLDASIRVDSDARTVEHQLRPPGTPSLAHPRESPRDESGNGHDSVPSIRHVEIPNDFADGYPSILESSRGDSRWGARGRRPFEIRNVTWRFSDEAGGPAGRAGPMRRAGGARGAAPTPTPTPTHRIRRRPLQLVGTYSSYIHYVIRHDC